MHRQTLKYLCALFATVSCQVTYRDVNTLSGPVRGYNADKDNVFSFYGIPYATAPTGEDRFKTALPPPIWSEVFNATTRDVVCPQAYARYDDIHVLIRSPDCLKINVFVPDVLETNLPVMAYIHGGGFQEGYVMLFSPVEMASKGIIIVNFNHRVGVYGFLCLGTEFAPGNAGIKDIVDALKWVKDNIASFGGDPDNVTLGGSSSGGSLVDLLILSPMANGLFNKAVSEGGTGLFSVRSNEIEAAKYFATITGQRNYTDATIEELEKFYKSVTDDQLSINFGYDDNPFVVCIETHEGSDKIIDKSPMEILQKGEYIPRPYMISYTPYESAQTLRIYDINAPILENDLASLLPYWLTIESEEIRQEIATKVKNFYFPTGEITYFGYIYFFSDKTHLYSIFSSARLYAVHSPDIFMYQFIYNGTVNLPVMQNSPVWVPAHVAQSLYCQEHAYTPIYDNMTDDDYKMQDLLHDFYIHFMMHGNFTQNLSVTWEPATAQDLNVLVMDLDQQWMEVSPLQERLALWDEIYNYSQNNAAAAPVISLVLLTMLLLVKLIQTQI